MYNRRMTDFRFFHPVEVRYGDLDPQGHVNNAKYLTFFEQARVRYMIHLGLYTQDQSFTKVGVIVADAHILFSRRFILAMTSKSACGYRSLVISL